MMSYLTSTSSFARMIANRVTTASLGGIESILAAMSAHKDHSGVQEQACGALMKLAADSEGMVISGH